MLIRDIPDYDLAMRGVVAVFFGGISIMALAAPALQSVFGYPHGEKIYSLFSPICHQYPTRSLWILDRPFALCSRCFSGYLGVAIGAISALMSMRYSKRIIVGILLLLPGISDGLVQLLTIYESNNFMRVITGFMGGYGIFVLFYPFPFSYRAVTEPTFIGLSKGERR